MEERVLSREERRKARENEQVAKENGQLKDSQQKKRKKKPRIRLIPIWLRLIIVAVLTALSLAAGAMVGYGVIGDGEPMDALKIETWKHIYDIIFEGTPEE